jgi:hypothetical protein
MKRNLLFLLLILGLSDCRKRPDFSQLSDNFVTATNRDLDADFTAYKTYYVSDTIKFISDDGSDSAVFGGDAALLIQTVKDSMSNRGYTFVPRNANPDLGITLTAIRNLHRVTVWWPGWWDPWWNCYWGWCFPWYYPWSATYTYTIGTVILNMYDLKNATKLTQIRDLWNITALGSLNTSTPNLTLARNSIIQGFVQSPYVQTK